MTGEGITSTLSGYLDTFVSYLTGDIFMIVGFTLSALFVALLGMMFIGKGRKLTIWHGVALVCGSFFVATIVTNQTNLAGWISLGVTGVSIGATLFVVGMIAMTGVMLYNLFMSKGRILIR